MKYSLGKFETQCETLMYSNRDDFARASREAYKLDALVAFRKAICTTAMAHRDILYNEEQDGESSAWVKLLEETPEMARDMLMLMPIVKGRAGPLTVPIISTRNEPLRRSLLIS